MQALDVPLPAEVTGSGHGWFTRYRTYPVFSPAWGRGRARAWLAVAVAVAVPALLLAVLPLLDRPLEQLPLGGLAQMAVQALAPIALGPWLAGQVRQRMWSPRREWWSLVLVMTAQVVALLAFHRWAAEPMKQWLAEQVGAVDETGRRLRIVMAVGVSVMSPRPGQPVGDPTQTEAQDSTWLMNTLSSAALTLWLGGGLGLWGWRRERASLAALAQARELAQAQAQRREAELRLSVLAAQVEPHFLFNTLAGVRSAIATDPGRASDMIDRLVDYLRAAIPRLRNPCPTTVPASTHMPTPAAPGWA